MMVLMAEKGVTWEEVTTEPGKPIKCIGSSVARQVRLRIQFR